MRVCMFVFITALITALPSVAQTEDSPVCPADFEGYLMPRLQVGQAARVLTIPLNFRPEPTINIARTDQLQPGTTVDVLAGPACTDGYVWWQVNHDGKVGWLAEGSLIDDEYYLERRGAVVIQTDAEGVERRFIQLDDGTLEREDCLRPPDDYSRVQLGYATLNRRTLFMLDHATRLYQAQGGAYAFRDMITQGSYNPGGVDASFGTHDGGGAVDLSVRSRDDWSVLWAEIPYMIEALRVAGFAAWVRETDELYEASPIHIHAIAVGDADLSAIARAQIDGERGYLRGYNGLPESYGLPRLDGWGDTVICGWMIADGFPDLRDSATFTAIGEQYLLALEFETAIANFSRSLTISPDPTEIYRLRGQAYDLMGDTDSALADYERYLAFAGESADEAIIERVEALQP